MDGSILPLPIHILSEHLAAELLRLGPPPGTGGRFTTPAPRDTGLLPSTPSLKRLVEAPGSARQEQPQHLESCASPLSRLGTEYLGSPSPANSPSQTTQRTWSESLG
jgi:hypothetical protein